MNPFLQHAGCRGKSVCKLHIACGIEHDMNIRPLKQGVVAVFQIYAVGQKDMAVKHSQAVQIFHRSHAVFPAAGFIFVFGFRQMNVQHKALLIRQLRGIPQEIPAAGIDRVRTESEHARSAGFPAVLHLIKSFREALLRALVLPVLSHQPSGDHRAHAALQAGPDGHPRKHLHVHKSRRTGPDHFHDGKQVSPVCILRGQAVLDRHHPVKKPGLKRKIIRIIAHEGHVCMRMAVDQSGKNRFIGTIDRFVRGKPGRFRSYGRNPVPFNIDIGAFSPRPAGQAHIFQQNSHLKCYNLLSSQGLQ